MERFDTARLKHDLPPDAGGLLTLNGPHPGGNRFEPDTFEQITRFLGALERQEQGHRHR